MVHLLKTKKELKNLCRQEIQILFTEMNLIKLVFNMIWLIVKSEDSTKRAQLDKYLREKVFKIASDPKHDGYQKGLASLVYKFFDDKSSVSGVDAEPNYQLVNELHREIIRNLRDKKSIHPSETIFGLLIQLIMQSLSKYNKGIKYLLCAIDIFNKYPWVVPLKHKRGICIVFIKNNLKRKKTK